MFTSSRLSSVNAVLLLILALASFRLVRLDADPGQVKSLLNNASDVGDEGYWTFAARNFALGQSHPDDQYVQAATSPLYALLTTVTLSVTGVSLFAARLPNALFAVLAAFLAYKLFEPDDKRAAAVAGLSVAVDNNFFIYTRIGHVEAVCGVFALLAYYLLIRKRAPFAAGVSVGLAVAAKIVGAGLVPSVLVFVLLQRMRGELTWRGVVRFVAGGSTVAAALAVFILWDLEGFTRNLLSVQSHGVAFWRDPFRTLVDFFTGYYLAYPSVAASAVLLGVYASTIGLANWFGRSWRDAVKAASPLDLLVICWLIGYAVMMIVASDMHHRRMNMFTLPLTLVPALLILRRSRPAAALEPGGWAPALPVVLLGALAGGEVLQRLFNLTTSLAVPTAGGAVALAWALASRFAPAPLRRRATPLIAVLAWTLLVSLSVAYSLPARILPNLGVVDAAARIAITLAVLAALIALAIAARLRPVLAVAATLLLSASLSVLDVVAAHFTGRDASRQLNALVPAGEFVVGDGAHALSLEGRYRPIQAYPRHGINADFIANVKPRFLMREVAHRDSASDLGADSSSTNEQDLYRIGAREIVPLRDFPLYPAGRAPAELTYRLYRVTY